MASDASGNIQIKNLFDQLYKDLFNKDITTISDLKKQYEIALTPILSAISKKIISKAASHKYNVVIKFVSLILEKKIILLDDYYKNLHDGSTSSQYYGDWREMADEKDLHWGKCFPKGRERHIIVTQVSTDDWNKNKSCVQEKTIDKKDVNYLECRIPDFSDRDRFENYIGFLNNFKEGIGRHFGYEDILDAPDEKIKELFETAVVKGWKSLYTATHSYPGAEFIGEITYAPSLYLTKNEKIDIENELDQLKSIEVLYQETVRSLLLIEQKILLKFLGLEDIHHRVWNTLNDTMDKEVFDRYRVLPADDDNKRKDEIELYFKDIKSILLEIHSHFDDYCEKRGLWVLLNYYSLFLKSTLNCLKGNKEGMNNIHERLKVFRSPSISRDVSSYSPNSISWYGLLGPINDNQLLKIFKSNKRLIQLTEDTPNHLVGKIKSLNIPEDRNGRELYTDMSIINEFKNTLLIYMEKEPSFEFNAIDIPNTLFKQSYLDDWNECLIFSSKYKVEFANMLDYFPNAMFFKTTGEFSKEDMIFCKVLNELYVKLVTKMLVYDNELLLDRLEDLVDSKPKRIFDGFIKKEAANEKNYIEKVKKLFDKFVENDLEKHHPIIKNDVIMAFYLYWTQYFKAGSDNRGSYLLIEPWKNKEHEANCTEWWKSYWEEINTKKYKFDLKPLVFDLPGEKTAIEFERLGNDRFKGFVLSLEDNKDNNDYDEKEEFRRIVIGNIDVLDNESKTKYYSYIKKKLESLLKDMHVSKKDREYKDILDSIGDGEQPAKYVSLFCKYGLEKTDYKYVYYIPSVNYDGSSNGGFSFFCKNKWPHSITKAAEDWATRFGTTFAEIEARKIVAKHGTKAAVSAIMARNMSHNIGSHAISRWNMKLNGDLSDLSVLLDRKGQLGNSSAVSANATVAHDELEKYKVTTEQSKDLFQYLQHRMDFIAEVSTSIPSSEMTMDFNNDILEPFERQKVLLSKIGDSEGFSDIVIERNIHEDCKRVSIPNGIIGAHAVYSIFENFIRNAAKHYNGKKRNSSLKIKVELSNSAKFGQRYVEMKIWDTRNESCSEKVVKRLRKYLDLEKKGKFIDSEGRLEAGGWGFKEMITAANFLRKNPTEEIIGEMYSKKEPPLMNIICSDTEKIACKNAKCHRKGQHKNRLGVLFYLRKPMDMLVLKKQSKSHKKGKFEIESKATWPQRKGKLIADIPHRLLLVPDSKAVNYSRDPKAPVRIMKYDNEDINDVLYLDKYEEFIKTELNEKLQLPVLNYLCADNEVLQGDVQNGLKEKYITGKTCNEKKLIFLFHPESFQDRVKQYLRDKQYFHPMSGAYPFNSRLQLRSLDEERQRHLLLELIETGLTKIVIIDERISDLAKQKAFHDIKIGKILKNMEIDVVDINKKEVTCNKLSSKIRDDKQYHFLIIHQGILDKLEAHTKGSSERLMVKIKCKWRVVDSGRGVPPELKDYPDVRFVEISSLLKMLETYDKHALVQTLFSLRRPDISNNG